MGTGGSNFFVLFMEIRCGRPAECAAYVCVNAPEDNLSHLAIARRWRGDE